MSNIIFGYTVGSQTNDINGLASIATCDNVSGPIYNISRLLGATSTLALTAATNTNLTLSGTSIIAATPIGPGNKQKAVIRESLSSGIALEYPVTLNVRSTLPDIPFVTLVTGNSQVTVSWIDGASGDEPIIAHKIYVNGVAMDPIYGGTSSIVTGLQNGSIINIQVSAMSALGEGVASPSESIFIGYSISPSPQWTGAAGSGFTKIPVDPVRTTAKPALRLITPPNQYYNDSILVGVVSGANNSGSFTNNGLQKVTFYYEGTFTDITVPTYETFTDVNGISRTYFGWWIRLRRNGLTNGLSNLYVESFPLDPTMQARVIGPYQYGISTTMYDYDITVDSTQPAIANSRYQSMTDAMNYLVSVNANHPRITVTGGANYTVGAVTSKKYASTGYLTVTATVPVVFGFMGYTTDTAATIRPQWDGLHFMGSNITIDFKYVATIYNEFIGIDHWFDGINVTNSDGRYSLWRAGNRQSLAASLCRGRPYYTECSVSNVRDPFVNCALARGNQITHTYGDMFSDAYCVIGNNVSDQDASEDYSIDILAMSVSYNGSSPTATLSLTNENDAALRTFTAVWSTGSSTFSVGNTESQYHSGNCFFSDVANWINGLGNGWSASVIDNSRRASSAGLVGGKGAPFTGISVKNTTLTVASMFDVHADWYQLTATFDNVYVADNIATEVVAQGFFLYPRLTQGLTDYVFVNNAINHKFATSNPYSNTLNLFSQLGGPKSSHLCIVNNSLSYQGMMLRNDQNYTPDKYCIIANNTFKLLYWTAISPAPDLNGAIINNHLQTGGTAPAGSSGTTIGGTITDLFVDAVNGNFTPAGALLTNLKPTILSNDANHHNRAASDAAGAIRVG